MPSIATIVASDLGRFKSVACVYDRTATFHTLASGRGDFASRFACHLNVLVVVEVCGRADGAAHLRSGARQSRSGRS